MLIDDGTETDSILGIHESQDKNIQISELSLEESSKFLEELSD